MKDYTYNDDFLAPHNPNGDGYTEETQPEEDNYDNPNPPEEEPKTDLTTMLFKQLLSSF